MIVVACCNYYTHAYTIQLAVIVFPTVIEAARTSSAFVAVKTG